jgi:hypothetical protein
MRETGHLDEVDRARQLGLRIDELKRECAAELEWSAVIDRVLSRFTPDTDTQDRTKAPVIENLSRLVRA